MDSVDDLELLLRISMNEMLEALDLRSGRTPSFEGEDELTFEIYRTAIRTGNGEELVDPKWPENMGRLLESELSHHKIGGDMRVLEVVSSQPFPVGSLESFLHHGVHRYLEEIDEEEQVRVLSQVTERHSLHQILCMVIASSYLRRLDALKRIEASEETALAIGKHALARTASVSVEPKMVKWGLMGAGAFVVFLTSPVWVLSVVLALFLAMWSLENKTEKPEEPDG